MGRSGKVIKNASWIIVCRVIQSLLSLLIGVFSARYLGPSNYGLINYAASLSSYVLPIMQLGLSATLVKEIINAEDAEGEVLGTALGLNFVSSLLAIGGVLAFSSIASKGETETIVVCVLYSIFLIFEALEMIQYWFYAKLKSKYTSITMLVAYALTSVYKIFLLVNKKNVYWFALSQAIDYCIIAVTLLVIYKKIGGKPLSFSFARIKPLLSRSWPYILSSMLLMVFTQTDKLLLKHLVDDQATGYYAAACACAGMTIFVFNAIIDSFQPIILAAKKVDQKLFETNMVRLYACVIFLSILQGIGITLLADIVIKILYGSEYLAAVNPLRLMIWSNAFYYLAAVRNVWILAEEKQRYLWVINLFGAIVNILINVLLIPVWGAIGAALASLITQIFTNVVMGFVIKDVRRNNYLMWKGCNPKVLIELLQRGRGEDDGDGRTV